MNKKLWLPLNLILVFLLPVSVKAQVIDLSFVAPSIIRQADITVVKKAANGKVYLLGDIDYHGTRRVAKVIRLTAISGFFDASFKADLPPDFKPKYLEILSGGNVLVADIYDLFLLSASGTRLQQMHSSDIISAILAVQGNKFLVAGAFGGLRRFTKNFFLDATFNNQLAFVTGSIYDVKAQGDKFIISGSFNKALGVLRNDLVRITENGTLDLTFNAGLGTSGNIGHLFIQPDLKIIPVKTAVYDYNGVAKAGNLRINADGTDDLSFHFTPYSFIQEAFYKDGKIIINTGNTIVRANDNGSIDATFSTINTPWWDKFAMAVLDDNTIIASNHYATQYGLARFDNAGVQIAAYAPPVSRFGVINSIDTVNSSLLIGGDFFKVNSLLTHHAAKLELSGMIDASFHVEKDLGPAYQTAALADGSVLISSKGGFMKVNDHGSLDPSFSFTPFKTLFEVTKFKILNDGKIMASGPNTVYRLMSNGSEDKTFSFTSCCSIGGNDWDFQSTGKLIFGSVFTTVNGIAEAGVVRLDNSGNVDQTFNVGTGPGGSTTIVEVEVLGNDEVLVNGYFGSFNGEFAPYHMVKLSANGQVSSQFAANFQFPNRIVQYKPVYKFRNTILLGAFNDDGTYSVGQFNYDGRRSSYSLPVGIGRFTDLGQFFSTDLNTLYISGKIELLGSDLPVSMVRINYPGSLTSQARMTASVEEINVYPNPVKSVLRLNTSSDASVQIYNLVGETKLKATLTQAENGVNVEALPPGRYVMTISSDGKLYRKSFIKD